MRYPSGFCEADSISATACVAGSPFPDIGYTCDTEPGSSGSAVLGYSDNKVVGLHHCGGCPADLNTGLDIVDIIADLTASGNLPPGSTFDPIGRVRMTQNAYGCSQTINIELFDDNLIGAGTQGVTIHSVSEPTDEDLTLAETPAGSGKFVGSIGTTTASAVHGDSLLSVANGDSILVTYVDATDGAGGTNIPRTDGASVDCAGPIITNVQITDIQGSSAVVRFTTNEAADSRSDYGLATAPPPSSTVSSGNAVTVHALLLTGIVPCNNYIVRVSSTDPQGNSTTSDNGGAYYQFNSGLSTSPTYAATGLPIAIPTASPTPTVANIVVPDNKTVVDVNVKVNLTHTFDADMVLTLRHPDGTAVLLSNLHGGGGDNYTNTVFDDSASTAIGSGAAPFTGSFIPDQPLSGLNGKNALGTWKLEVFDNVSGDGGSLISAEITLVYPAQSCGPDAAFDSGSLLTDSCSSGGVGSGNGFWDDGEEASFRISLRNTGTTGLTGVTATLASLTPGVALVDDTASYSDLAPDSVGASQAPDFRAQLAPGFACGGSISFSVQIHSNEGTFSDTFSLGVAGELLPGSGTALFEDFAGGIPGTWSVVDGGAGGGAAATWTTANPGNRVANAPMELPMAIVDSDFAGTGPTQDETLASPVIDLSAATSVTLQFDHYFRFYSLGGAEKGDVDVRSSATGGIWVNVLQLTSDTPNPQHKTLNVTAQTAGTADAQVRFHYYGGAFDWYWFVDNVRVDYTGVGGCSLLSCAPLAPPGEVASISWSAPDTMEWTPASGATSYNVYRGTDVDLPKLFTGDVDSCLHASTAAPTTSLSGNSEAPAPGTLYWWLVRGSNTAGEGSAGSSSLGPRVHDSSGSCP